MRNLILLVFIALCSISKALGQAELPFKHLASHETGMTAAAETVAFDPGSNRAFYTNSDANALGIIDLTDPANPAWVMDIDFSPYGDGPNSVDVHDGLIAVAVQADPKTDPGVVVFFAPDGQLLGQVTVGSLPDMLTFTPDGQALLVANEGEPNDDYSVDPEGTVSVIDLSNGPSGATVQNLGFAAWNNHAESLRNRGIRIFGPNATVAQDLEPEFITVTGDGQRAYVSCQEANALAVIDLGLSTVVDLLPLGYKDHQRGRPELTSYILNDLIDMPALGTPAYDGGQATVYLGGFSGLYFDEPASAPDHWVFYAVPDRGPNTDPVAKASVTPTAAGNLRPYKLPDYQARLVKFSLNPQVGTVQLEDQILLHRQDGVTPISGKGNIPGFDEVPVAFADPTTPWSTVDFTDGNGETYTALPYDALGGDMEGVVRDKNGDFWLCDENRPALYKFQPDGTLIERFVPEGTSLLGLNPQPAGTYGTESLPSVYSKRWANRGFEAIAYDPEADIIYAFIQSPIDNPNSATVRNKTDMIRILGVDAATGTPVSEYAYVLERNALSGFALDRVDKIGDAVYTGNGEFLVLERDSSDPNDPTGKKYIFRISIRSATNLLGLPISQVQVSDGAIPTLEMHSIEAFMASGYRPVKKTKVANLPTLGYKGSDKTEGIAQLPDGSIAIINDNDFGLAGAGITDNTILGILSFTGGYGMDPSDKDGKSELRNVPTLGMFMPDGIALANIDGHDYIVTANEGDSRDYDGYSEEVRVKDLDLDPLAYPDAAALQASDALGRLKSTSANGDVDHDGDVDQIYSYGARSFSIWDTYGNLVFDSGDEFARLTMQHESTLFNEDGGSSDGRSDDKGVEPEAVAIGEIDGVTYAFVGFERQSAIVAYDISNPWAPEFVTWYNHRDVNGNGDVSGDVSPEIIRFVKAEESPNGENLLVVGYEVSGSVGIIQVGGDISTITPQDEKTALFKAWPNPTVESLFVDQPVSGQILDLNGKVVTTFRERQHIDVRPLEAGVYVIRTEAHGTRRFLKL